MWNGHLLFRAFQSFEVNQTGIPATNVTSNPNLGGGSFYDSGAYGSGPSGHDGTDFDNEPPLLEELGINPNHIFQKVIHQASPLSIYIWFWTSLNPPLYCILARFQTLSVLNPFRTTEQSMLQDADMAGPLVFCLTLGAFLLLVRREIILPMKTVILMIATHYRVEKCPSLISMALAFWAVWHFSHCSLWWQHKHQWLWAQSYPCSAIAYFQWSFCLAWMCSSHYS